MWKIVTKTKLKTFVEFTRRWIRRRRHTFTCRIAATIFAIALQKSTWISGHCTFFAWQASYIPTWSTIFLKNKMKTDCREWIAPDKYTKAIIFIAYCWVCFITTQIHLLEYALDDSKMLQNMTSVSCHIFTYFLLSEKKTKRREKRFKIHQHENRFASRIII